MMMCNYNSRCIQRANMKSFRTKKNGYRTLPARRETITVHAGISSNSTEAVPIYRSESREIKRRARYSPS